MTVRPTRRFSLIQKGRSSNGAKPIAVGLAGEMKAQ